MAFVPHVGEKAMQSYLAMNLPFKSYEPLLTKLKSLPEMPPLISRGEAHITVITPPEFDRGLKPQVSIQEINRVAEEAGLQKMRPKPICIGEGRKEIEGVVQKTYFVVMESPELVALRDQVQRLYVARGGNRSQFVAQNFYPHVTLGYTLRDLHFEDGVIKDKTSCIYWFN
ncbi:MAG: hypothetical protein EOP06_17380 [Proteobacteria bacterium]|nr:MAG: hypothetical protein EOP06_17380 [Pseudomonadota bacterium]